ncbi:hypothetical protein KPH14_001401, partial [Odynerus spinipes]
SKFRECTHVIAAIRRRFFEELFFGCP